MSFFDTTHLGRILSAFSKHQYHIDESKPDSALQALQYIPLTLGAFVVICITVPFNWAPAFGCLLLASLVVMFVTPAENKLKAADAASRPPIFSHLAATLEGLFSIRAYHAQARFERMNLEKLDHNHELMLGLSMVKSWTALYLDLITSFVIYFTAVMLVEFRSYFSTQKELEATAGLAISNALQILVFLQWSIRMLGEVQAQISSVGVLHYYAQVPQEAPALVPEKKPPSNWPSQGQIEFKNVVLKYHEFGVEDSGGL
ncbi:Canalicular multispecific organic anion transporter 1 [Coelomomyces lativittatus]|nr:Canalicular multispecific organic anion transporter 1 [Coelomomyces lativittatus]